MTTAPIPLCESCARLGPGSGGVGFACAAFSDGIPDAIYMEGYDHRQPYPGDGGVLFRLKNGEERALAAYESSQLVG